LTADGTLSIKGVKPASAQELKKLDDPYG